MFELLEDTDRLPVPEDTIILIHGGMNKVRVSVANYVSEPSDVYIITSEDGALLRSHIVFFIVEHGTHMIYGYSGNPYDPGFREEVVREAVEFVEEMGTILEEIPWQGMSQEERRSWLGNESIYPRDDTKEMEEILDLEEIEPEELQEVVEGEEEPGAVGEVLQPESLESETIEEVEPGDFKTDGTADGEGGGEEIQKDSAEEDGDFDNLLKQAFLKPDLVKKSSLKKVSVVKEEMLEDGELPPDEEDVSTGEETQGLEEEAVAEPIFPSAVSDDGEGAGFEVSDEDLEAETDDDLTDLIKEINAETSKESAFNALNVETTGLEPVSGDKTRMTVIRYLSRF